MHILIVDDSKAMQNIIARSMKAIGFTNDEYDFAFDGDDALQKIRSNPPDLVLCDLHMPNMSGIEVVETIRHEHLPVKAGIVSIERGRLYQDQALAAGASFYLHKPFTSEQLFSALVDALGENPLAKKSAAASSSKLTVPDRRVVGAALSALAQGEVDVADLPSDSLDYSRTPFIVTGYIDEKKNLRVYFILDCVAANSIAAQLGHITAQQAMVSIGKKEVGDAAIAALNILIGLMPLLIRSDDASEWLSLSAVHQSQEPSGHLKKILDAKCDSMSVMSIGYADAQLSGGKLALCLG